MIKWLLGRFGYISINKLLKELEKDCPIQLPSAKGEIDALLDPKEEAYKIAVFKEVFNTRKGRLVLDFLKAVYTQSMPNFDNPNVDYYMAGKSRVVNEIDTILNKKPKKKENE